MATSLENSDKALPNPQPKDDGSKETSLLLPPDLNSEPAKPTNPTTHDVSFLDHLRAIKAESRSCLVFIFNAILFILSSVFVTVLLLLSMAVPIAMVAIGAIHLKDCPTEDMIPIYLVVAGAVALVKDLASLIDRFGKTADDKSSGAPRSPTKSTLEKLVDVFLCAWFLMGCVYIYRTYDDFQSSKPEDASNFCNYTVYWFSFWTNTIVLMVGLIGLVCFLSATCCLAKFFKK